MKSLHCPDVESRIELYAADECDAGEAEAIRRHLEHCPRCAATCAEARQLVGLVELRLQEPERLRRLEARLAAEVTPRRQVLRFPSGLRRVAALAAMLLLAVGPVGWLTQGLRLVEGDGGLVLALREAQVKGGREAMFAPAEFRLAMKEGPELYRAALADAKATGKLPPPPAVDLTLELRNPTDRPLRVWVAGPQTELRLDLRGPGAVSVAKDGAEPEPRAVTLPPGQSEVIRINSLTDGRRSWYWTEPGDYTVTAQLTTLAWSPGMSQRRITVRSAPVTIPVPGK